MAENDLTKFEDLNVVDEDKSSELEADNGSYVLFEEPLNIEGEQDETDGANAGPKRKKSGILGRLSTRKKKKKTNTKEEISDDGKTGSNVELNEEKSYEQDEAKNDDIVVDTVASESVQEKSIDVQEEKANIEEEKSNEADEGLYDIIADSENVEPEEAVENAPKKKTGLLRKLSVKKKKKKLADDSKNGSNSKLNENTVETEDKPAEDEKVESNPEEKQEESKDNGAKKEDSQNEETLSKKKKPGRLRRLSFSKPKKAKKQKEKEVGNEDAEKEQNKEDVQNVQEKCDVPETTDQSPDSIESNQPITKESEEKENDGNMNKSYLYTVVELPMDMAQKAFETIRNVFKPVLIYIIRKNPHCFKDIIESNNTKNACCPTQM